MNRQEIALLGVNHKTAPVEVRECLALQNFSDSSPLELLSSLPGVEEVVFLSTCNRVEALIACRGQESIDAVKKLWLSKTDLNEKILNQSLYVHKNEEAIRHLFRVASSLDSMVVGEPQILGQIKDAYRKAAEAKVTGMILNRLLHKAFSVAKRVRTETRIASHAVSISYAAVELARKIFGDLYGKTAMLIGAGEMAELAAQHLKTNGIKRLIVANRTLSRAVKLSRELGGEPISLEEIDQALVAVDIVISSTGAPGVILTRDRIKKIMRPRRHNLLFFIDIAVPRDIDPAVNDVENVYLYDIDDLKGIVEFNKTEREKEAARAERIIEAEVIKFKGWMESLGVVPVIQNIQKKGEEIRQRELSRSKKCLKGLTPEQEKAMDILTRSIVQKLLSDPIIYLKKNASQENNKQLLDITSKLFGLDESGQDKK